MGIPVTDPMLLQQLSGSAMPSPATGGMAVTDSALLAQLNAPAEPQPTITQPWWHSVATGMYPFGIADKIKAATSAAKESLSGGLPFGEAYSQALPQYEAATQKQGQDNPTLTTVGKAVGSIPPLLLGGEAINAGLRSLGSTGRFLAGEADVPSVARDALGYFRSLSPVEKALNLGTKAASRIAQMGREGAQAGAFGAASDPNADIAQGAERGALIGTAAGALAPPIIGALGKIGQVPATLAGYLPGWAQGAVGVLGGEKLFEHAPRIAEMMTEHPVAGTVAAGGLGALGTSAFLAAHPELRDLVTRMGLFGYAASQPQRGQ